MCLKIKITHYIEANEQGIVITGQVLKDEFLKTSFTKFNF